MKKLVSMLIVLTLLMGCASAFAANMGVQIIGGPEEEAEPVSLDDVKLNVEVEIDRYGIICPTEFGFNNEFRAFKAGSGYTEKFESGKEADYAIFRMDIINTSTKPRFFATDCEVKMIYDDVYEYSGWYYQANSALDIERGINEADNFAIEPMYEGHYIFGCTLPNAVVNSKKPLRMEITIDGNEITYYVRK